MWPMIAAAGLMTAGSLAGSLFGKKDDSGEDIAEAMDRSTAAQREMYGKTEANYAPFLASGQKALPYMEAEAYSPLGSSPSYQWQLKEGERTLNNYLAARGLLGSGAGIRKDVDLTGRLTAAESDKKWEQYKYLSQMGMGAAGGTASAATATGQGLASTYMTGGMGLAANSAQQARDTSSLYSNLGYGLAGMASGYGQNEQMMKFLREMNA